jgi:hypothetical protein
MKRIDFVAQGHGRHFALEIKWARTRRPRVMGDLEKLRKYRAAHAEALGFLCVFGRKSSLAELSLPQGLSERGLGIYADFGKTRFGCRIFQSTEDS